MSRVSAKESILIHNRIIDAAARMFSTHGVDAVSVSSVFAEIGQSPGGFYGRFRNKDALAADACTRLFDQVTDQLESWVGRHEGTKQLQNDLPGIRSLALLSACVARSAPDSEFNQAYQQGMKVLIARVEKKLGLPCGEGRNILADSFGRALLNEAVRLDDEAGCRAVPRVAVPRYG